MSSAFSTSNAIDKLLWTGCVLDTLGALPKESSRPATGAHSNYAVLLQTFFLERWVHHGAVQAPYLQYPCVCVCTCETR